MKTFNCSINKYIEADSEEEAIEIFCDMIEHLKLSAEVQCFEHTNIGGVEFLSK